MSPLGAIFVPFPPKTRTNLLHPPPPPIVERVVGCKSDSEILASLETVETVVRTQKHRLEADKFPIFSVGGPGKDFIAIWIPVGLSSGLSS